MPPGDADARDHADEARCRLCGGGTDVLDRGLVLGQWPARLHRCRSCGYVQFASPSWLDEAYADAITSTDLGLLRRSIRSARRIRDVLAVADALGGPVLDWGGGHGTLTRLLRDAGIDCLHWDPRCTNLFARGFEAEPASRRWSAVVALEVVEHLGDPWEFFGSVGPMTDLVIFSTEVLPEEQGEPPPLAAWPYYAPEHGQHVGFMAERSIRLVASRLGMAWTRIGWTHVLSRGLGPLRRLAVGAAPLRWLAGRLRRTPSLLMTDHRAAVDRLRGSLEARGAGQPTPESHASTNRRGS